MTWFGARSHVRVRVMVKATAIRGGFEVFECLLVIIVIIIIIIIIWQQ